MIRLIYRFDFSNKSELSNNFISLKKFKISPVQTAKIKVNPCNPIDYEGFLILGGQKRRQFLAVGF